ncbi:MAG: CBS domain-containing protein [Aromatoleum sp.]|jgi:CBS domain-containing protein|uniref:CBS domain-containing protein n=1 Tax=Aromatoleum sp. TaxID=2307007 RepID=UPI0028953B1E|nr:CBS domain-containing protein [Aromatoleum sp.]MDT3671655.1 CBS domain-containing protein [Aromatoleum sp.]
MLARRIRDVIRDQKILVGDAELTVREASRRMAATQVGAIMIALNGRLVGIFTERDALVRVLAAGLDPDTTRLGQVMTDHPLAVTPDTLLGHALHLMHDGGFRHVPVVEDGQPVGMVSARDALGMEMVAFEDELNRRDIITQVL